MKISYRPTPPSTPETREERWLIRRGNLIGINTAIYSRSGGSLGIGFAITASVAKQIMEQIIQSGGVTRGWIGVEVQDLTPELAESFKRPSYNGALIAGVLKGGPADRAGVKPGIYWWP